MAAGVIRNITDFQQASALQHPFYCPITLQDNLTEDEDEDEEDEGDGQDIDGEGLEDIGDLPCQTKEEEDEDSGSSSSPTETTYRLLHFADLINSDIQRYFGRKNREEDPDSCDIYEDRMFMSKCGRERYYADLVKMAQNGMDLSADHEAEQEGDLGSPYAPLQVEGEGQTLGVLCSQENVQHLGPLAELFDVGLQKYIGPKEGKRQGWQQRGDKRLGQSVPMSKRRLPASFWTEPIPTHPTCMLGASSTPDFSDLLANWTTENSQDL